jgi:alcohol dehydrogenase, propanol-preferring
LVRAVVLEAPGRPLAVVDRPSPTAGAGEVLVAVEACAVCRTDLHLRDGEIPHGGLPRILGHQVVGRVVAAGPGVAPTGPAIGDRVGIPWLAWTCGECRYCQSGRENLCVRARFTGRDVDGGFAEFTVADARYCLALPSDPAGPAGPVGLLGPAAVLGPAGPADLLGPAVALAPLLCGGLIGYRALRLAGPDVERIGLYGFGSAAHLICQVARGQGREVFAFVRRGDEAAAELARSLGASWVGPSDELPPAPLDAAIIFASDGSLVPLALRALSPGGTVVCAGIHMSDIPSFPYAWLWEERSVQSVANLTRDDGRSLLEVVSRIPVVSHITTYPLDAAEQALADLRAGAFVGSAVLEIG